MHGETVLWRGSDIMPLYIFLSSPNISVLLRTTKATATQWTASENTCPSDALSAPGKPVCVHTLPVIAANTP
jgi:hypothetical protein